MTIKKYRHIQLTYDEKQNQLTEFAVKEQIKEPPTKYFVADQFINNMKRFEIPKSVGFESIELLYDYDENKEGDKENGLIHAQPKYESTKMRSHDDLDIGMYEQNANNVAIGTNVKKKKFSAIHSKKYEKRKSRASMKIPQLSNHGSLTKDDVHLGIRISKTQSIKDLVKKKMGFKNKEKNRQKLQNVSEQKEIEKEVNMEKKQKRSTQHGQNMKLNDEQKIPDLMTPMNTLDPEHYRKINIHTNNMNMGIDDYQNMDDLQDEHIASESVGCNVLFDWISKMCGAEATTQNVQYDNSNQF